MRTAAETRLLYAGLATIAGAIFVVDAATPLGIAVWILYIVPVSLTLAGRSPTAPIAGAIGCTLLMVVTTFSDSAGASAAWVAYINRVLGVVVIWSVAIISRNLIESRNRIEDEEWMRTAQGELLEQVQGELTVREIGDRVLARLGLATGAQVGALYTAEGGELRLAASRGVAGANLQSSFAPGEGLVGEAVRGTRSSLVTDVAEDHLPLRSAFLQATPHCIQVAPLRADGTAQGVIELGFLQQPSARSLALIDRISEPVAVALRSAYYRGRLRELLQETQQQAEELQAQQEELRVSNEELEEQTRALSASQSRLEAQQAELEANNAQLETQAHELELNQGFLIAAREEAEQASRYKSEFLANMSHELRTPLNSALILAKLLAQNAGGRLSPEQVRYAETIYSSGTNLLTLINDILDLAKIEAGAVDVQPEDVSPRALVESLHRSFQPMADERGLGLTIEIDPAAPETIVSDPQRLQQILTNLLSNAFKFTERGQVSVHVSPEGADEVIFAVSDTGIGVPPERFDVIFEAFRQADGSTHRKFGGTGLGLSISLELARLLGGDIRVASTVGSGSTFTLVVPRRSAPKLRGRKSARAAPEVPSRPQRSAQSRPLPWATSPGPAEVDGASPSRSGRTILVIEDDPAFARILYDLAQELDFDCVIASTVEEGMALARERVPSGILLDVSLPDGSGLTLLDRLKRNPDTRHIPVHMVSASDHVQTALELGAIGFVLKPVAREQMIAAMRKLESRLEQRVRRILVVEDDPQLRDSLRQLLRLDGVVLDDVGTARDALARLASDSYDCVVLDLNLPDASGYEILETMSANEQYSFPPVIVYTGRALAPEEEERLRRYSRSVIVKGARSPERLLDEVTLFLHQIESRLPPESQRLLRHARERDGMFEGRTILVVEDDVRNIFALSSTLESRGARVAIARNGREAIASVTQSRPDLVLMDIMMPEMDGLAAMRALRAEPAHRDLPIIALTAKAMRDDYEQCLAAGANDYLAKPLDVDKLISLCRVWMAR